MSTRETAGDELEEGTAVADDRATELGTNQVLWNHLTAIHRDNYPVEAFRRGATTLDDLTLAEVGDVDGLSLLHLQCHFGLDTLSWARRGARVTGVDFADDAIDLARELAADLGIPARFVASDVYALREVLDAAGGFDVVFSSWGVLVWLPDLTRWAEVVAHYLKPGGRFHLLETHPMVGMFDDGEDVTGLRVARDYLHDPEPSYWPGGGVDYADLTTPITLPSYEWQHDLGEVVTALAGAGLRVESLREHEGLPWRPFPFMVEAGERWWRLPDGTPRVPLSFSVTATKPEG